MLLQDFYCILNKKWRKITDKTERAAVRSCVKLAQKACPKKYDWKIFCYLWQAALNHQIFVAFGIGIEQNSFRGKLEKFYLLCGY
jgi:hypothetical protein